MTDDGGTEVLKVSYSDFILKPCLDPGDHILKDTENVFVIFLITKYFAEPGFVGHRPSSPFAVFCC